MAYNRTSRCMKKNYFKVLLSALALFCMFGPVYGQISEGESYSRTIRTGNRPVEGNWGLFVGTSVSSIHDIANDDIDWTGLPLINFKYFSSDNTELRLGIEWFGTTEKTNGDLNVLNTNNEGTHLENIISKNIENTFALRPGIAYHFSPKNLLDVYVGGELPFGIYNDRNISKNETDIYEYSIMRRSFSIGLGGFIGLQCFVADLPIALGLEYGLSYMKHFGQKYKYIYNDGETEQIFYTHPDLEYEHEFDRLKNTRSEFGNEIRITISYYFN